MKKKTLCIDFDGVLHFYLKGWQGPCTISEPPVDGAIEWLESLVDDPTRKFELQIQSARGRFLFGNRAIKKWLVKWGFPRKKLRKIRFSSNKPALFYATLDDKAICFNGKDFPSVRELNEFEPWYEKAGRKL